MTNPEDMTPPVEQPETKDSNVVQLPASLPDLSENRGVRFAKEHPMLIVAGGLAIGALAATLIPRRNREYVSRRTSVLADAVTTASLALASQALQKAEAAGTEAGHRAHLFADRAGRLGGRIAGSAYDLLPRSRPKTFSQKVAARLENLRGRFHG